MGRVNFQEVVQSCVVSGKCPGCGKRKRRTLSETATVNPFNRTEQTRPDGTEPAVLAEVDPYKGRPKTRAEVARETAERLKRRAAKPFACAACEQSGAAPAMSAK